MEKKMSRHSIAVLNAFNIALAVSQLAHDDGFVQSLPNVKPLTKKSYIEKDDDSVVTYLKLYHPIKNISVYLETIPQLDGTYSMAAISGTDIDSAMRNFTLDQNIALDVDVPQSTEITEADAMHFARELWDKIGKTEITHTQKSCFGRFSTTPIPVYLAKAIKLATNAHSRQKRKGTDQPFITHLERAYDIASELTDDVDILAAVWLHDILEDTSTALATIRNEFPHRICHLVKLKTEDKTLEWEERKRRQIYELSELTTNHDVVIIAYADKTANLLEIKEAMDSPDYDDVWSFFKHGKDQQSWYYTEYLRIFEKFPDILSKDAVDKYRTLLESIFGKIDSPPPERYICIDSYRFSTLQTIFIENGKLHYFGSSRQIACHMLDNKLNLEKFETHVYHGKIEELYDRLQKKGYSDGDIIGDDDIDTILDIVDQGNPFVVNGVDYEKLVERIRKCVLDSRNDNLDLLELLKENKLLLE